MKIAISGKGGVGKTTLSASLAAALALQDRLVIALDADPDSNLASALGVPDGESITPLADMHDMIAERTGTDGDLSGYFKLNPKVDDIPEDYARKIGNIRLLVLGGIAKGGSGCICPATTVLKTLLLHLLVGRNDAIIMDMEAGIEHLGRATAQSMDALVLVVNDSRWSINTALRAAGLAGDLGMKKLFAVANRVTESTDIDAIAEKLGDIPLIGQIPFDERLEHGVLEPSSDGIKLSEALSDHLAAVEGIISELQNRC